MDIKRHFIRDTQKRDIELSFVNTEDQIADIFIKLLTEDHFYYIKNLLNIVKMLPLTLHLPRMRLSNSVVSSAFMVKTLPWHCGLGAGASLVQLLA